MSGSVRLWIALIAVAVVALVAVASTLSGLLGTDRLWPVLIGAAVGLAPGAVTWRLGAFVAGLLAGWGALALQTSVLPDRPVPRVGAVLVALAVVGLVSVATRDRAPLWAGIVGVAAFLGFADVATVGSLGGPGLVAADRLAVAGSLMLATGVGAAGAVVARSTAALAMARRPATGDEGDP